MTFQGMSVTPNGRVVCYRVTKAELEEMKNSGYGGLYLALCGHREKVRR